MCYDYEKLMQIFEKVGFEDITVIDFDALSAGKIDLAELTGKDDYIDVALPIEKHNSSLVGSAPASRMMPRVSLKSFWGLRVVKRIIGFLGLREWPGYRHCAGFLDRVTIREAAQRELIVPLDVAERLDA